MKTFLLLAALVVCGSMGEILSAKGMKQVGEVSLRPRLLVGAAWRAARSRHLIAAVFFHALAFFSLLALLSYAEMSYVVPLTAAGYITNTLGARFLLKERINRSRWIGTLLVAAGVTLVSLADRLEGVLGDFRWVFALRLTVVACVAAAIFFSLCTLWAGWLWSRDRRRQRALGAGFTPPVTILIPVRGAEIDGGAGLACFCRQDYPDYQIVFGAREEIDPAVAAVRRLQAEFPGRAIEIVVSSAEIGHNAKVSNLENMLPRAAHDHLIIVDSDIRVGPDYLRRVVAPMREPRVGLVTCLYRGAAPRSFGARLENLGMTSTFGPEVILARALQGLSFALGSTMLIRLETLASVGGFRALADYLADDYVLGRRIAAAGHEVVLSDYVVEHDSGAVSFADMLRHQLRWARTVRVSRPWGHCGLILTYGTATSLLALAALNFSTFGWALAGAALLARLLTVIFIGVVGLGDRRLARDLWLVPLRDLINFGVWLASFAGDKVEWRGATFEVRPGGKIRPARG